MNASTTLMFDRWVASHQQRCEDVLAQVLPEETRMPERLHSAMRYAVLGGGKRVRALLCFAAAELAGAVPEFDEDSCAVDAAAAAVELIHAFSLVHDDMPCMDDDDLRRGKASCHKQYDDATALLVGDALQSLAFTSLAESKSHHALQQIQLLAIATGSLGMCGGQSVDLQSTGKRLALPDLETMHQYKTGALIRAAVLLGAYAVKSFNTQLLPILEIYSRNMGLAFQVVDDILDATADTQTLGKTAGKDQAQDKSTYVSLLGIDAARALVNRLYQETLQSLASFGHEAEPMRGIARFICERSF